MQPPVIDFHAHVLEPFGLSRGWPHNVASGFGAIAAPQAGGRADRAHRRMLDPDALVQDMDAAGIDVSVISLSTVIAGTQWADPATDLALSRRANDHIAGLVAAHPDRLVGSCSLPLQDLDRSLGELARCVGELRLRVVNLPAQVRGAYLGDPRFGPLWDALAADALVAFIHPHGVSDPWFRDYSLWNSVGQPIEEAKVLSSIIYEGVLERWPQLPIVVAHGGGFLPHYYGRHDRNVANRPETARNISRLPSDYLRGLYYDSCVYVPEVVERLVELAGADHVVMGSDHPVGEADPCGFIDRVPGLDDPQRSAIKGGAAAALLARAGVR